MSKNSPLFWFKVSAMAVVLGGAVGLAACGGDDGGGDGDGGSGGDGGDSSGGKGGKGGSAGSSANIQDREVKNCPQGSTVREIEQGLIKTNCATESACHTSVAFGNYKYVSTKSFALNFIDKAPRSFCTESGDKIIDSENPSDSFFVRKLKEDKPKCIDGNEEGGDRMPQMKDKLDDETITCLEEYVKAVVGKN